VNVACCGSPMKAKKRYAILLLSVALCPLLFFVLRLRASRKFATASFESASPPSPFASFEDAPSYSDFAALSTQYERHGKSGPCTMGRCFNRTRCKRPFKVYVYPDPASETIPTMSEAYAKIVKVIRLSNMYTSNPEEACLFVLSLDTLDRDRISQHYVKNMNGLLASLPSRLWNEGRNHLIFNLYHGTYPDYKEDDFGFDPQLAMMARASTSVRHFRPDYDVSFPLFHNELPFRSSLEVRVILLSHSGMSIFEV
jgi:glucuronyl/N-acetylglucosaminyl transferase EXT1